MVLDAWLLVGPKKATTVGAKVCCHTKLDLWALPAIYVLINPKTLSAEHVRELGKSSSSLTVKYL